jgi:hypothetical protein
MFAKFYEASILLIAAATLGLTFLMYQESIKNQDLGIQDPVTPLEAMH